MTFPHNEFTDASVLDLIIVPARSELNCKALMQPSEKERQRSEKRSPIPCGICKSILPRHKRPAYETLVTFVGMDGFGLLGIMGSPSNQITLLA